MPQFTTANITAFCTYFATFAIFFFTALYLVEVVGRVRLPAGAGVPADDGADDHRRRYWPDGGRSWSGRAGRSRIGCLLFATGLFLVNGYLNPHPDYGPADDRARRWPGIGIGTTVVPITSAVLAAVPPERSGMAASAANTSREIGAVTGVAILGSLVVSQLRSSLTAQLHHLGIPAQFQALVINALETGQIPKNTSAYAGFGKIVQEVIGAAYTAFRDGLHAALYLSAGLMLGTGLLTFLALRSRPLDR